MPVIAKISYLALLKKRITISVLCFSLLFINGCGTIITQSSFIESKHLEKKEEPDCNVTITNVYSGVLFDINLFLIPWVCPGVPHNIILYPPALVLGLIDLPLCVVTDTIILPYTIYNQIAYGNIENKKP